SGKAASRRMSAVEEAAVAAQGDPSVRRQRLVQNQLWRVLQGQLGLASSALPAGRVIKPQIINQAVGLPASSSLYYFNYLDSTAYPPSELLSGHLFPSGLLNALAPAALAAHPKLFLLENAKLAGLAADKFPHPAPYPHKEPLWRR
ncbi:Fez zinc finger protein 2, partial [Saguinus oedipus]